MASSRELIARCGLPKREAELLLQHCLGCERAWLIAHDQDELAPDACASFEKLVEGRIGGEPLAYLMGRRDFWSLDLAVNSSVLIPRPDTELLVSWSLEVLRQTEADSLLDLGTGSGAIALAVASEFPACRVTGVDQSPAALKVARANGARLKLPAEWLESDWFSALAGRQWPVIASNPPYIRSDDPHLSRGDLPAEPGTALVAGSDGLDCLRQITAQAPGYLDRGGWLLLEHGWDQGPEVRRLLQQHRFENIETRRDLVGHDRVTGGQRW